MSEVAGSTGRLRLVSAVLPGVPQLLAGRRVAGAVGLSGWLFLSTVFVLRFRALPAVFGGGWDAKLAVLTLLAGLAGIWTWSWRSLSTGTTRGHALGQYDLAVRAFAENRVAVAGLCVIVILYLLALLAPLLAPHDPTRQYALPGMRLQGFSSLHPLGTDELARDVLSRLLYGARISLSIGLLSVGISVTIGTLAGALAGFMGGVVDATIMRVVDMFLSFPRLVLLITITAIFQPSIFVVIIVLGLTLWPNTARLVRGEVLSLREREFVLAAEALGVSRRRIITRHLIPNALGPVIVAATLGIGNTIVLEAGLSFLALGVQPPTPSWGLMVADGRSQLLGAWWLSTLPGLAIVFTVLAFNLVGDGLRDALDPRFRS